MTYVPELSDVTTDDAAEDLQPLLSKRDVAIYLGVSERTVDRWVAAGELPAYRVGGHRRFRLSEVDAFVDGNQEAS